MRQDRPDEFQSDNGVFSVREGTAVRVNPEGERCLQNTSEMQDLYWIVIQSRADSNPIHTIQKGFSV